MEIRCNRSDAAAAVWIAGAEVANRNPAQRACLYQPRCLPLSFRMYAMAQPGVRAAQPFGNPRVSDGETLDVRLIDDRFLEGTAGRALVAPVEVRADHHGLRHEPCAVAIVRRALGIVEPIGEDRLIPVDIALDRLGVRIEQELRRVAPLALLGRPRSVDTEPVALAGLDVR